MFDKLHIRQFTPDSPPQNDSVYSRVETVKQEMNNFLGLLQKSIESERHLHQHISRDSQNHPQPEKKLSTILSASEECESSENPNSKGISSEEQHYYDKYFDSSSVQGNLFKAIIEKNTQKAIQRSQKSTLVNALQQTTEFNHQSHHSQSHEQYDTAANYKLFDESQFFESCEEILGPKYSTVLEQFRQIVRNYNDYISVLQNRNEELLVKCEKYKVKSDHLLRALNTIRGQEKGLVQKYRASKEKLEDHEKSTKQLLIVNDRLSKEVEVIRSENTYLKDLIILANKNYENIQKKLSESQEKCKKIEATMRLKESEWIEGSQVLKDIILKLGKESKPAKQSSPLRERNQDDHNRIKESREHHATHNAYTANKLGEVEEAYRKMFLKTLKCPKK